MPTDNGMRWVGGWVGALLLVVPAAVCGGARRRERGGREGRVKRH
jgi:hypothetical protein